MVPLDRHHRAGPGGQDRGARDRLAVAGTPDQRRSRNLLHDADHGGTVSVYLSDPDGTASSSITTAPRADCFDPNGRLILQSEPFD